jgi:hypothetical protein
MNKELIEAIKSLRPTAEFSFTGEDYATVKWDVLEGDAPTLAQINAEIAKLKKAQADEITNKAATKLAIANRLGLTQDELATLLS